MTATDPAENFAALIREYSEAFDMLRNERHNKGAAKYGLFEFVGSDIMTMMMTELADTANYCEMQFIKLMMLQKVLENDTKIQGEVEVELNNFKGSGEVTNLS